MGVPVLNNRKATPKHLTRLADIGAKAMPIAKTRLEYLQVRKLIQCVREKDGDQIDRMVALGLPNILDLQEPEKGHTALHVAVILNLDSVVTRLLNHGSSTAIQDLEGCTPAMRACEHGHLQALEALSLRGLSINVTDLSGRSAVFHCLYQTVRHVKALSFLLEFGADPNTKSVSGMPILCAICQTGYAKLLDVLLKNGADPNAKEPETNKPAVVVASEGGHKECVRLLAEYKADLSVSYGENGLCAVHRAAALGHFGVLQVLSAYGADFSAVTAKTRENGCHFATVAYKLLCIRFLGQRGCPANEPNHVGNTPQKIAKGEGLKDAMKELKKLTGFQDKVAKGSKPKGYAESWSVRLFDWLQANKHSVYTTLKGHVNNKEGVLPTDVFQSLLRELGIFLSDEEWAKLLKIYDKKGEGSLNWDDLLTDHKYVHAQYQLGPDDDIKGKKGKKGKKKKGGKGGKKGKTKIPFPIYFEAERPPLSGVSEGCIEKFEFVTDQQRFTRDSPSPHCYMDDSVWYLIPPDHQYIQIYEAVRHGDMQSLVSAFREGASVDTRDKYNKTCLMIACAHGRLDIARFLIKEGADINAIDNFMWTPLHHACHAGEEEVVKLLLSKGANLDVQSYNGGTPLMRAIETSQKSIVKLLMERGAKLTPVNKHGETALEIARNWGDDYIYALLYANAASLPPPPEAKGKAKSGGGDKGKKSGGKKGKKEGKGDGQPAVLPGPPLLPVPPPPRLCSHFEDLEDTRRRSSFQSLRSDVTIKPVPYYQPKPAWINRPSSTKVFQDEQMTSRNERGTESVDFGESRTPFQLQIIARAQALEISDV